MCGLTSVSVAVVDSGVHPNHPHVGSVAGGVGIAIDGAEHEDFVDRLGHGTAVAAAIREKAPRSVLYAVKVFDQELSTSVEALVAAIDWAVGARVRLINLSLGMANAAHVDQLRAAVERVASSGTLIVAAAADEHTQWLPGSLPGVVPVALDWNCPRDQFRWTRQSGTVVFAASGLPRPIPGVSPSRNLQGLSFAVANLTGFLARAMEEKKIVSCDEALALLTKGQKPA